MHKSTFFLKFNFVMVQLYWFATVSTGEKQERLAHKMHMAAT